MEYLTRLKELRTENKKTQQELAKYLNIKQNTYSQYENGQRSLPIESLILLAKYYEVSTDYILNLTDI
jgi:transcriptional regulator with XRE-family HTH domain